MGYAPINKCATKAVQCLTVFFALFCLRMLELDVVSAEVIQIPVGEQAPEYRNLPRPTRGMSRDAVLNSFGKPLSMGAPVGQPPISKWVYENFTVYFESETVIHSVLTHKPKHPELLQE